MLGVIKNILLIIGLFALGTLILHVQKTYLKTKPASLVFPKNLETEGFITTYGLDSIGFHSFSPDGKYFIFTAFTKEGANPKTTSFLVTLNNGEVIKLPGFLDRGFDDSRVIQLWSEAGTILYFPKTKTYKTYTIGDNVFGGSLSPDGKWYMANTTNGLRLVNITTGEVAVFSTKQYDGAYAWLSNSKEMLGFKETGENLFEAGKGRVLGIWNTETKAFTSVTAQIKEKNIRYVAWIKEDSIARVNTGYDDGSHDYLVNIQTGETVDLGDTSGALMAGMATDKERGLFAVVNELYSPENIIRSAKLYKGLDEAHSIILPGSYSREQVMIVNADTLLYIRKAIDTANNSYTVTKAELVKLDFKSGTETVIFSLPTNAYTGLSLSPDKETWVVGIGDKFVTGKL